MKGFEIISVTGWELFLPCNKHVNHVEDAIEWFELLMPYYNQGIKIYFIDHNQQPIFVGERMGVLTNE
jgi:hypothetical protein